MSLHSHHDQNNIEIEMLMVLQESYLLTKPILSFKTLISQHNLKVNLAIHFKWTTLTSYRICVCTFQLNIGISNGDGYKALQDMPSKTRGAHCTEIDFALSFGAVLVKMIDLSKTESTDFFGIILDQENSQKLHLLLKSCQKLTEQAKLSVKMSKFLIRFD